MNCDDCGVVKIISYDIIYFFEFASTAIKEWGAEDEVTTYLYE